MREARPELEVVDIDEALHETWVRAQSLTNLIAHWAVTKDAPLDEFDVVPAVVAMVARWADQAERLIREATA